MIEVIGFQKKMLEETGILKNFKCFFACSDSLPSKSSIKNSSNLIRNIRNVHAMLTDLFRLG